MNVKRRVLVCGGRNFKNYDKIKAEIEKIGVDNIEVIIHGEARGADSLAQRAAWELKIPTLSFQAEWWMHGKSAGPIRNRRMLKEGKPDLVLAFPCMESIGTKDMIKISRDAGIETLVFLSDEAKKRGTETPPPNIILSDDNGQPND